MGSGPWVSPAPRPGPGTIVITPILQMRKLSPKEAKSLPEDHTAGERWSWDSKDRRGTPAAMPLTPPMWPPPQTPPPPPFGIPRLSS